MRRAGAPILVAASVVIRGADHEMSLGRPVAIFLPTLSGGGVERNMLRAVRALVNRGVDVEIVLARATGELLPKIPTGIPIVNLGVRLGHGGLLLAAWPLAEYLRRRRPSALWSHMTEANIVAVAARRLAGVRTWLVLSERNTLGARVGRDLRRRALPMLARALYPRADRIHAVSHGVKEDLARVAHLPAERIQVIYNPIVSEELFHQAEEPLAHPWFAPSAPPVILGVGRLVPQKGFSVLLDAFRLVRQMEVDARLVILGEGPERERLQWKAEATGVANYVLMPGFVHNPFQWMRRASVVVLSSVYEGFGNVVVEAMALGTPVVSTDCPSGPREILEDGRWGELVPVGDPDAMAQAIVRALTQRDTRRLEGARHRAMQFSVGNIVNQYLELLLPPLGV